MVWRRRVRGDEGQVMLLSIAYGVLALLLVTAVVSATGIHLERKRLLALADLTALAAADAMDDPAYYAPAPRDAGDGLVRLTPDSVRAAVDDHLAASSSSTRLTDVTVVEATTTDGRTAHVTLRAVAHPVLLSWATAPWSDGVVLQVTAGARTG